MATIGIIANPSSGKDIRRLVARGSVVDNNEKVNIVRRALVGMSQLGARRVLFMPDYFGIALRAIETLKADLDARVLDMPIRADSEDSTLAASLMEGEGAACIITIGGDGTNRVVARGCGAVPLIPISTGTNNVFPVFTEGTLAGMAAGLIATEAIDLTEVVKPTKRLEVFLDGQFIDAALVDVALCRERFVGSRAIWDPATIRELVLAIAEPGSLGLSSIGAHLSPVDRDAPVGLHLRLATDGNSRTPVIARVIAPIAPGLVKTVAVAEHRLFEVGETIELAASRGSLALDGERELPLISCQKVSVRLGFGGPRVIDVRRTLAEAARLGRFIGTKQVDPLPAVQ